jgi:hypothetical protein
MSIARHQGDNKGIMALVKQRKCDTPLHQDGETSPIFILLNAA